MNKRLPPFSKILPLYSVIVVMSYGWTIVTYLWKLPSWLLFLTLGEVSALLAYALVSALLESLVILAVLLLMSLILPARLFRDEFIVRGVWFVGIAYGGMMGYLGLYASYGELLGSYWMAWTIISISLALVAAYFSTRFQFARSAALWFSDQAIVFLFILPPVSVISLLVVIIRNLN